VLTGFCFLRMKRGEKPVFHTSLVLTHALSLLSAHFSLCLPSLRSPSLPPFLAHTHTVHRSHRALRLRRVPLVRAARTHRRRARAQSLLSAVRTARRTGKVQSACAPESSESHTGVDLSLTHMSAECVEARDRVWKTALKNKNTRANVQSGEAERRLRHLLLSIFFEDFSSQIFSLFAHLSLFTSPS
jgi:hypothetical protein